MMTSTEDTIQAFLVGFDPNVRELVNSARKFIRESAPGAREKLNPGWGSVNYSDPEVGYFVGIFPKQDRVDLVFEFGVLLPDPQGLLKGDGSQVRHVQLRPGGRIPSASLGALIAAALQLPADRATRLDMVRSGTRPTN